MGIKLSMVDKKHLEHELVICTYSEITLAASNTLIHEAAGICEMRQQLVPNIIASRPGHPASLGPLALLKPAMGRRPLRGACN